VTRSRRGATSCRRSCSARHDANPPLSATELVGACTLLLFAGHETTTGLIGNSAVTLATHPDDQSWLRDHPAQTAPAVEELHRFDGSQKLMVRIVDVEHERLGVLLHPGQTVFLGTASANRDAAMFEDPDELRLQRANAFRHLGFGYGLHFCLGAPLARLETQVAIGTLVRRCPDLRLAIPVEDVTYGASILGRAPTTLPVTWRP
jgi:cytochrome P450